MTKRNPEFGGFSACFAVRTETDLDDPDEEDEEISTHSAREDGDQMPLIQWQSSYTFQPTPPARTETYNSPRPVKPLFISTHSAREDGDPQLLHCNISRLDFNPLRPRGRRLYELSKLYLEDIFQPTPPARTETKTQSQNFGVEKFQPTPPARTETFNAIGSPTLFAISTHSAREDGDYQYSTMEQSPDNFNPLRPRGRRL